MILFGWIELLLVFKAKHPSTTDIRGTWVGVTNLYLQCLYL